MSWNNPYRHSNDIIVVTQEDFTGKKIAKFKSNSQDEEEVAKIFQSIIDKYSMNLKIIKGDGVNKSWLDADEDFQW